MPIKDTFQSTADSLISPATICFAIVPANGSELAQATKAIYVGTGGDIALRPLDGTADVTFRNVPDGAVLDVRVRAVRATGTTAADIVGLA